jgi:hypothetical protein
MQAVSEPSYDVFISHKSEYRPWVEWLARALRAQGRSVFVDFENLIPGGSWVEDLYRGLAHSRSALLVVTPEVVNSGWVREEYFTLLDRRSKEGLRLVPVVLGDQPNLPFLGNLQAVDCRDPARFRDWFHRILCGLDGKEPGSTPMPASGPEPPPALAPPGVVKVVPSEESFVRRLMRFVCRADCPPILVAARGNRFQGPLIQDLLESAKAAYGPLAVQHVIPPFSDAINTEDCFSEIWRQCGNAERLRDATAFVAAVERRILEPGSQFFLLVTGFESAADLCRREFAGALKTLTERQPRAFRVVLLGGIRLMEQKYAAGFHSFLSHATVEEWPQPTAEDLLAWQQADFPSLGLTREGAQALIDETGAHADLLHHVLKRWDAGGGDPRWPVWCYECPELWETWYRLARNNDRQTLREQLVRNELGAAVVWPADGVVRSLYWADLLTGRGSRLEWRTEVVRQVGREVLA